MGLIQYVSRLSVVIFVITLSLDAADAVECASGTIDTTKYLPASDTAVQNSDFRKTCLPDANNNLQPTLNTRGGIYLIGNQVMCKGANGYCTDPGDKVPNNNITPIYADHDDNVSLGVLPTESNKTSTSTMAHLTLKSSDKVIKAKLFWIARYDKGDETYDKTKTVKLLTADTNSTYIDILCTHYGAIIESTFDSVREAYCSADVTPYIKSSGDVWVGDILGRKQKNSFSAWAMYVVYTNKADPYQNISVYEGFKTFDSSSQPLDINLTGFLTPEINAFDASLHIFSGESDFSYGDNLQISDSSGAFSLIPNQLDNNVSDFLNASISAYGSISKNRVPNFNNALGIDIDSVYIRDINGSGILDNNQTKTTVKFTSTQDQLYIPMIALTTELYKPLLCYDYGYEQNGRSFTEENNGSLSPRLRGDVIPSQPIALSVYIKNLDSGSILKNIQFTLRDLNSTQVAFDGNISQTYPGSLAYHPVTNYTTVSGGVYYDLASQIPNGERIFTQMQLTPLKAALDSPLAMSLNFEIEHNATVTIPYSDFTLDKDVPLCSESADYNITQGIYSIVDKNLNQTALSTDNSAALKYNLFTQTTDRNFTTELVAFDPNAPETVMQTNDLVAVELINVGHYHDPLSSCLDPKTKITTRQWLHFAPSAPNADANLSHMPFIPSDETFFHTARENVTFRIWHLIGDDNVSGVFSFLNDGRANLKNFANTAAACAPSDKSSVTYGQSVSTYCSLSDMDLPQQKLCAECLFGHTIHGVCSRDNFAIRPESFDIKILDINHTFAPGTPQREASKVLLSGYDHNLSAGYSYRFEVNATTHTSNDAAPDYTRLFDDTNTEHNVTFLWTPKAGQTVSGCNDTASKSPSFYLLRGQLYDPQYFKERSLPNVGRYTLDMTDTSWTKVDQAPAHHKTGTHWLNTANDCLLGSDAVPPVSVAATPSNMGCTIRSVHTNSDSPLLSTLNHTMTFHPYKFLLDTLTVNKDENSTVIPKDTGALIYMSDLNKSTEMAYRITGAITPAGEDNSTLSNFVDSCYAQDVNITLAFDHLPFAPKFQYRLEERNMTQGLIHDTRAQSFSALSTQNILIPSVEFIQPMRGLIESDLSLNFERNASKPINIQTLLIKSYTLSCSDVSACRTEADLKNSHIPVSTLDTNNTIFFGYGRVHAPRYRFEGNSGTVNTYYEVYCTQTNCNGSIYLGGYGLGDESVDDVNWFTNSYHRFELREGNVTNFAHAPQMSRGAPSYDSLGTTAFTVNYGAAQYPFKTKVRMSTQPWLLYHPFDPTVATNDFFIEFFNPASNWQGASKTSKEVDSNAAKTTNRRINW